MSTMLAAVPNSIGSILKLDFLSFFQPLQSIPELKIKEISLRGIREGTNYLLFVFIKSIAFDFHSYIFKLTLMENHIISFFSTNRSKLTFFSF